MADDFIPDDDFVPDNKPEGLLQSVIKNFGSMASGAIQGSRMGPMGGTSIEAIMPTSGQEGMDLAKVAGRQIPGMAGGNINFATEGPAGIGLNAAGINKATPLIPPPQSSYGKNLEMTANVAPWAALGGEGAMAGAKGISKFFSSGSLPQEIGFNQEAGGQLAGEAEKVGNEITGHQGQLKDLKTQLGSESKSYAYTGKQDITGQVGKQFDAARSNYKDMLQNLPHENVGMNDMVNVLDKTIEGKNILGKEFPTPEEQRLVQMRFKAAGKIPTAQPSPILNTSGVPFEGETPEMPKIQDPTDFKSFRDEVFRAVGNRPDLEGEFLKHYGTMLEDKGLTGLKEANVKYQGAYGALNASKSFTEPNLQRIATGKMPSEKVADLSNLEQKIGTDYVSKGKGISSKYQTRKGDLENLILNKTKELNENDTAQGMVQDRIDQLNEALDKVKKRRTVATGLGLTALGGGAGYEGYRIAKGIHDLIGGGNNNNEK